jgi:hypothetical protein
LAPRLSATGRENNAARLRADEMSDFVTGLFDGAPGFTRGTVRTRWIANDTVLPAGHCFGHLIAPRCRSRVIEVVLSAHAT